MVSGSTRQKVHLSSFLMFQAFSVVFVVNIECKIRYWNSLNLFDVVAVPAKLK